MSESPVELDPLIVEALDRHTPVTGRTPDWPDVLHRARSARTRRQLPTRLLVAATAAVLLLVLATPIGSTIRQQIADFSNWLAGTPGSAVSEEEQRAFEDENARSWLAFPGSPELRRLIRTEHDGVTFDLLGFRSGDSFCLRVRATGEAQGSTTLCAPIEELRLDDAPARVLMADWSVGRGEKKETIGFDTVPAPLAQVTAGIAADGVAELELVDEQGRHRVDAVSNAFLYVAERPDVGQRVARVTAALEGGATVEIPFAVSPWGPGGGHLGGTGGAGKPGGPTEVERVVERARIGWVDRREERGEPIAEAELKRSLMLEHAEFARVLTPDPGSSKRIAISVGTHGHMGPTPGQRRVICTHLLTRGGASGGCMPVDDPFFRTPFTFGATMIGAGDQFATFSGVASDEVVRLELYTATGDRIDVPLRDNAYLTEVSLARLPAKLVAYDSEGRVIGIEETPAGEGPARPYGKPIVELERSVTGVGSMTLIANRTREGGQCWQARGTGRAAVNTGSCIPRRWVDAPLRTATTAVFLYGRVRDDVKRLELRFDDGQSSAIAPGEHGYLLAILPDGREARELVEIVGHGADGEVVARQRMRP
jgi:hypothetical protein